MTKTHKIILGVVVLALISLTAAFALNGSSNGKVATMEAGASPSCCCLHKANAETCCSADTCPKDACKGSDCGKTDGCCCKDDCKCCDGCKGGNCTCEDCKCCACCKK